MTHAQQLTLQIRSHIDYLIPSDIFILQNNLTLLAGFNII